MAADQTVTGKVATPSDDYDGPLLLFADFMNVLGEHNGTVMGAAEEGTGVRMTVTELAFDLPMELRVRENETNGLILRAGPPTQRVDTTIFPVLHRLQVRLTQMREAVEADAQSVDVGNGE